MRPLLLDLCCYQGGSMHGYWLAGFDVAGVDLFGGVSQARNPYPTVQMDALEAMRVLLTGGFIELSTGEQIRLGDLAAIHASPPCQRWSAGTRAISRAKFPDVLTPLRPMLQATGLPYIIENVPGAPLQDPITLCGRMFGLGAMDDDGTWLVLDRHRHFESNVAISAPRDCRPHDRTLQVGGVYGGARRNKHDARHIRRGGYVPSVAVQRELLGIAWMNEQGLEQAIPPAYTRHLGMQLWKHIDREEEHAQMARGPGSGASRRQQR